jgi:HSP20 family protein
LSELFGELPDRFRGGNWQPAVDIYETEESVLVRAEVPGVRGEDLRVNVDGDQLRIRGVRKTRASEEVRRHQQMEIVFGPFERTIRISATFHADQVSAHLEDGFLEVTLPRRSPRRRVEVEER